MASLVLNIPKRIDETVCEAARKYQKGFRCFLTKEWHCSTLAASKLKGFDELFFMSAPGKSLGPFFSFGVHFYLFRLEKHGPNGVRGF